MMYNEITPLISYSHLNYVLLSRDKRPPNLSNIAFVVGAEP